MDYWHDYPPPHLLIRAYMGVGKAKTKPVSLDTASDGQKAEFISALQTLG